MPAPVETGVAIDETVEPLRIRLGHQAHAERVAGVVAQDDHLFESQIFIRIEFGEDLPQPFQMTVVGVVLPAAELVGFTVPHIVDLSGRRPQPGCAGFPWACRWNARISQRPSVVIGNSVNEMMFGKS